MTDPYGVEMVAALGFDWLLIDMEHVPMSKESLRGILMACKGSESVPIVRVAFAIGWSTFRLLWIWEHKG